MKGHDALAKALVDQGVDTVFGLVGDGNLFVVQSLVTDHDVRYVAAAHEAAATLMAAGWATASGRLGVATVTHGPGLTNTFSSLIEGVRNRIPMLLVCGDVPAGDPLHLQRIPQHDVVAATGAGFVQVRLPQTICQDVAVAVRRAWMESRPIVLNMPLDFEWEDVEYDAVPRWEAPAVALSPDPAALDRAVGILASSSRPLVLAGRGAVLSNGGRDALVRLAHRIGAPVATTVLATGLFEGDPFNLGICGTVGNSAGLEAIAQADCVIAFGAALNQFTTDKWTLLNGKAVIQVDLDPARVGALGPITAGVVGDVAKVADTIVTWLDEADHKPSGFRSPELEAQLKAYDATSEFQDQSTSLAVDPRTLTVRLDSILPKPRNVVLDAGRFMINALKIKASEPMGFVTSHAFGAIGQGMATAVGTAVARPQCPTVLLIGDGGFMMGGMGEFAAAVQQGIDLIVVVYNDGSYGAEHIQLFNKNLPFDLSLHRWPEFSAVAAALGGVGIRVANLEELADAETAIRTRSGHQPVLIDVKLDPEMISRVTPSAH